MTVKIIGHSAGGERLDLYSPKTLPKAGGFLWNPRMLLQVNCRGYVVAQHMQPEPGKYSHAPTLEAQTFFQPEHPFYAHHPGRFCYVRDEDDQGLFSVPHEPVRDAPERYLFSVGRNDIRWQVENRGIEVDMSVALPADDIAELWEISVRNTSNRTRSISIYPCFSVGYMSWMNQSARYREDLGGVLACSVTPYQKLEDYPAIKALKDCTYFIHDQAPVAWETSRETFEGEGGIQKPDGVTASALGNGDALYETPIAALQYQLKLAPGERHTYRFVFGPAHCDDDVAAAREKYLGPQGFERAHRAYVAFQAGGHGCLAMATPDPKLDTFVNRWLPRQVFYIARAHRLTTDPQTRNFLQDNMGSAYVTPSAARDALCLALSQQEADGRMPEGILLNGNSRLKYINQIPHNDHCVWLPIALRAYLNETGDSTFLDHAIVGRSDGKTATVLERVTAAMHWQLGVRDQRNLSLMAQGDWCDPMNMVGHKGRGVSAWLSMATVYAAREWAALCDEHNRAQISEHMLHEARLIADAVQTHLWDGDWFARGITDDGIAFGISDDVEGRIFLNPQSWAMLAGIATDTQQQRMLRAVNEQLDTPYGAMMLAPAYTAMREDIGRVTQKHPGSAENGSIYNHAAMFYVYALYQTGHGDRAFEALRRALPADDNDDLMRRGQLPIYIPNYYRGAVHQFPRTAGRSSHLFHTGAASWFYRIVIEELFGLKGCPDGLKIHPQLPSDWPTAQVERQFRGATFVVSYQRDASAAEIAISVDGAALSDNVIRDFAPGQQLNVTVTVPDPTP
ncbi:MAG: NdvB protein [Gammaproteobacteria bacterium]